jgi:trehalose 6-phosphate synthase/phosphatase
MLPIDEAYEAPCVDGVEAQVSEAVSRINSDYGSLEYQPVHVSWQTLCPQDYTALLSISNCLLVTPERDSMNSAVLDYVVCQEEAFDLVPMESRPYVNRWGIPIISEFLGLSSFMPASFQINPFDFESTVDAVERALEMSEDERRLNSQCIAQFVYANTQRHWARSFYSPLEQHHSGTIDNFTGSTPRINVEKVFRAYELAKRTRIIILDYDGTISPIQASPLAAAPTVQLVETLRMLAANDLNKVYVISGRDQNTLTTWLGKIEGLTLVAEHGTFVRQNGVADWRPIGVDEVNGKFLNDSVAKQLIMQSKRRKGK